ncbi:MAG: alpha/beta hydrolase [Promethearchaeota archaeon]
MLSNTHKRVILIIIDLLFSWFIWRVNISLGNPCKTLAFTKCFILSTTTFLIVYTPFEIYWSIRDLWYDRWTHLYQEELEESRIRIDIPEGSLSGILITNKDIVKSDSINSIVIVCHGFSDTKETLQYFYYPLAYQGFTILAYDARGTGKSKKTGKRSEFLKRIEDFKEVVNWVKLNEKFSEMKIHCVGFSIGATTVLNGGISNKNIEKIIAISSMSNYKQNIPKFNPIVMLSYLMKGIKIFPSDEENKILSPYVIIDELKKTLSLNEWREISKRIMLIHSKNDRIIKFKNFNENRSILETPQQNVLILRKGGHSHKKNECALVGAALIFLTS